MIPDAFDFKILYESPDPFGDGLQMTVLGKREPKLCGHFPKNIQIGIRRLEFYLDSEELEGNGVGGGNVTLCNGIEIEEERRLPDSALALDDEMSRVSMLGLEQCMFQPLNFVEATGKHSG